MGDRKAPTPVDPRQVKPNPPPAPPPAIDVTCQESTEYAVVREMCARANMRYMLVVHDEGSSIVISGPRNKRLGSRGQIELKFDTDGLLIDCEGSE